MGKILMSISKLTLLSMTFLAGIHRSCSYQTGPPASRCDSMEPNHAPDSASTDPAPFTITASQAAYTTGDSINVTIDRTDAMPWKGFFLQARPEASVIGSAAPDALGTFTVETGMLTRDCFSSTQNAAGHNSSDFKTSVTVTWQPGPTDTDGIIFMATIVRFKSTFWLNVTSIPLPFLTDTTTASADTTTQLETTTDTLTTTDTQREAVTTTDTPTTEPPTESSTTTPSPADSTITDSSQASTVSNSQPPVISTEGTTTTVPTSPAASTTTTSSEESASTTGASGVTDVTSNVTMTGLSNSTTGGNTTTTVSANSTASTTPQGSAAGHHMACHGLHGLVIIIWGLLNTAQV